MKVIQIAPVSRSIQPKHRLMLTSFSTSELCGISEKSKSTSFNSKGRSREFLDTFFGKNCEALLNTKPYNKQEMKKVPAIARHEGRKGCAEKALEVKLIFSKTQIPR